MTWPIKKVSTVAVAMACLLSGCTTLAPEYTKPAVSIPDSWGESHQNNPGDISTKSTPFFNDPQLVDLIKLTLGSNTDLKIAALNLKKLESQYGVSRLSFLPNFNLGSSKSVIHAPDGIYDTIDTGAVTYDQYDVKIAASWEVDFWGRLQSLKEESLNEYLASQSSVRALKISLIEQVVSLYLDCLTNAEYLNIQQQIVLLKVQELNMMQRANFVGGTTHVAVIQAEQNLHEADIELSKVTQQYQQGMNDLQALVGSTIPESLFNHNSLNSNWSFPSIKVGLPSEVLLKRPDIVAAEYQLKAANANIGAARAAFFPSISMTAEGGTSTSDFSRLFSSGTGAWNFVPSINLPIFNGGRNQANLDIANINKNIEIVNYQKVIQNAFRDVENTLIGVKSSKQKMSIASQAYTQLQQEYEMEKMSSDIGQTSELMVVQKQYQMLEGKKSFINNKLDYLKQSVKLYSVIGGDSSFNIL